MKVTKNKVLKSALDPFLLQAYESTGILVSIIIVGVLGVYVMYKSGLEHYEIHKYVIVNGTQMILNGVLGHDIGVNQEIFSGILELVKQYKLNPVEEIQALTAIMNNLIEYKDNQAVYDLEGKKIQQVVTELQRLIDERVTAEKEVQSFFKSIPKGMIKKGWIE